MRAFHQCYNSGDRHTCASSSLTRAASKQQQYKFVHAYVLSTANQPCANNSNVTCNTIAVNRYCLLQEFRKGGCAYMAGNAQQVRACVACHS